MTRLLTCGFETGDVNEAGTNTIGASGTLTVASSTPTPRAGAYCLKPAGTASWNATYKTFALPAAKTEIWIRFAFFSHISTTEDQIVQLWDSAAAQQTSLSYSPSDGLLRLYRGASTLIGTSSAGFAQDQWHVLEWRTQLLTATTGTSEVWLDGNQVITFSGDNSNTVTLNVQTIRLGSLSTLPVGTGLYLAFDDIAVNDTAGSLNNGRPGDGRVILLTPNGAGSSTQLVRGGTDTGANYSQCNELPPSMAQYVSSATIGQRDLYALSDVGLAVQSVNCVEGLLLAVNSDAGGGSIAPTIKSGATTNEGTATGLSTSAGYVRQLWETDPNTSAAWTIAGVNAAEVGATIR